MFFQVEFSPVSKQKQQKKVQEKDPEEIIVVSLAPFTHNPKLSFEDVRPGKTATRKLQIKNPTKNDIELFITKGPPDEREVCYTWVQEVIPSEGSSFLEITWNPTETGSWRDVLTFEDGNRIKKDIPVVFKCVSPKKPINSRNKIKPISAKIKPIDRKPKRISPLKKVSPKKMPKWKTSPGRKLTSPKFHKQPIKEKRPPLQSHNLLPELDIPVGRRQTFLVTEKENRLPLPDIRILSPTYNSTFTIEQDKLESNKKKSGNDKFLELYDGNKKRNSSAIEEDKMIKEKFTDIWENNKKSDNECFDDSLEMSSPGKTFGGPLHSTVNLGNNQFSFSSSKLKNNLHLPLTPIMNAFMPSVCSTGEKSKHSSIDENNETYDFPGPNEYLGNISGGTYVKANNSGGTYVKANLSGGTYVKANTSAGTYNLDDSVGNLGSLSDYPGAYQDSMLPKTTPLLPSNTYDENRLLKATPLFGLTSENLMYKPQSLYTSNIDEIWNNDKKKVLEKITEESFQPSSGSEQDTPKRSKPPRKRKSDLQLKSSPPKKQLSGFNPQKSAPFRRTKVTSGLNLKDFMAKSRKLQKDAKNEKSVILHNPDLYLSNLNNPYLLANTDDVDPFISATLYYEPRWLEEQELRFKKWMNILLTPPEGLNSNANSHPVDVARLWQECKKREVDKAPTKEEMSSKTHVRGSLEKLRLSAIHLFRTQKVCQVLSKVTMLVENSKLSIRTDKNVHVDLGLQQEIMTLFLCYNPLWLRIGLETIFGRTLKLNSNSDLLGLSTFIMRNFFKDSFLLSKFKIVHSDRYALEIKKHILKKFLMLVYFLDCAKEKRLIQYDPCLFCKNAPHKESRELLLKFSSTLLSAVGDITKCLRAVHYVLVHKQTYIHEFDYSVENLGVDLRDGVRLTKIMEIILLRDNLVPFLRVPAISRLQKIHNVKLAFDALQEAEYTIQQDITPKDIVEGHREKTMSLLWQIIYKFQAPLFKKAVITVQNWWKCLQIVIKRRILNRRHKRVNDAAVVIQQHYRAFKEMQYQRNAYLNLKKATVTIQIRFRLKSEMWRDRRCFMMKRGAAIVIQRKYRATVIMQMQRNFFIQLKRAAIVIQNHFRANQEMKFHRYKYLIKRNSVIKIQEFIRSIIIRNIIRDRFIALKQSAICLQRIYRANKLMHICRSRYESMKRAAILIQRRFKATLLMRKARADYLQVLHSIILLQNRMRDYLLVRELRTTFLKQKNAAITIQRSYRGYILMQKQKDQYLQCRKSVVKIQQLFRANVEMKKQRFAYLELKNSVLTIEERFLAKKSMLLARNNYLKLRDAAVVMQRRFRAMKLMVIQQKKFQAQKHAANIIQRKFRANLLMRKEQIKFLLLKKSTITIQTHFRAYKSMHLQKNLYLKTKDAAIKIQRRYRAQKLMQEQRNHYLVFRQAVTLVQRLYVAKILMKNQRERYVLMKKSVLLIENIYLAKKLMETQRREYRGLIQASITIQRMYRATVQMKLYRSNYLSLKKATIQIQRIYRARIAMKLEQATYLKKRDAAVIIQHRFRAFKEMKLQRQNYVQYKKTVIRVQQIHRANLLMKIHRSSYTHLKRTVLFVEQRYIAIKTMLKIRNDYVQLMQAVVVIQRRYRAIRSMEVHRRSYITLRGAVVTIQGRYRAKKLMQKDRQYYLDLRKATIAIQQRFRANILMKIEHKTYLDYKKSVIVLQRKFRANEAMKACRNEYLKTLKAVVLIQIKFKAHLLMIREKIQYQRLFRSVVQIQRRFRGNKTGRLERSNFITKRDAVVKIQRWYRAVRLMRLLSSEYRWLRMITVQIQRYFRGYLEMKNQMMILRIKLETVVKLQRYGRGLLARRRAAELKRPEVIEKRKMMFKRTNSATKIQASWRGFLVRKAEPKQMSEIRKRYRAAVKNTNTESTIGHKKGEALKVLINENSTFLQIIRALEDIEYVTRRCKDTCLGMSQKLSSDVGDLIKSSGRSLPDMNASMAGVNILINFSKYPPSSKNAWIPQHIEGIILVMSHWCDKESLLFPLLCTLIWLYTHNKQHLKFLQNLPNIKQQMMKMKTLCDRKQKMMSKGNHKNAVIFASYKNLPLPSLSPDWGLELKTKPRAFTNSVHALKCLLSALKIE